MHLVDLERSIFGGTIQEYFDPDENAENNTTPVDLELDTHGPADMANVSIDIAGALTTSSDVILDNVSGSIHLGSFQAWTIAGTIETLGDVTADITTRDASYPVGVTSAYGSVIGSIVAQDDAGSMGTIGLIKAGIDVRSAIAASGGIDGDLIAGRDIDVVIDHVIAGGVQLDAKRDFLQPVTTRGGDHVTISAGRDILQSMTAITGDGLSVAAGRDLRGAVSAAAGGLGHISAGRDITQPIDAQGGGIASVTAGGTLNNAIPSRTGAFTGAIAGNISATGDIGPVGVLAPAGSGGGHVGSAASPIDVTSSNGLIASVYASGDIYADIDARKQVGLVYAGIDNAGDLTGRIEAGNGPPDGTGTIGQVNAPRGAIDSEIIGPDGIGAPSVTATYSGLDATWRNDHLDAHAGVYAFGDINLGEDGITAVGGAVSAVVSESGSILGEGGIQSAGNMDRVQAAVDFQLGPAPEQGQDPAEVVGLDVGGDISNGIRVGRNFITGTTIGGNVDSVIVGQAPDSLTGDTFLGVEGFIPGVIGRALSIGGSLGALTVFSSRGVDAGRAVDEVPALDLTEQDVRAHVRGQDAQLGDKPSREAPTTLGSINGAIRVVGELGTMAVAGDILGEVEVGSLVHDAWVLGSLGEPGVTAQAFNVTDGGFNLDVWGDVHAVIEAAGTVDLAARGKVSGEMTTSAGDVKIMAYDEVVSPIRSAADLIIRTSGFVAPAGLLDGKGIQSDEGDVFIDTWSAVNSKILARKGNASVKAKTWVEAKFDAVAESIATLGHAAYHSIQGTLGGKIISDLYDDHGLLVIFAAGDVDLNGNTGPGNSAVTVQAGANIFTGGDFTGNIHSDGGGIVLSALGDVEGELTVDRPESTEELGKLGTVLTPRSIIVEATNVTGAFQADSVSVDASGNVKALTITAGNPEGPSGRIGFAVSALGDVSGAFVADGGAGTIVAIGDLEASADVGRHLAVTVWGKVNSKPIDDQTQGSPTLSGRSVAVDAIGGVASDVGIHADQFVSVIAWDDFAGAIDVTEGHAELFATGNVEGEIRAGTTVAVDSWGNISATIQAGTDGDFKDEDHAGVTALGAITGPVTAGGDVTVSAQGDVAGDVLSHLGAATVISEALASGAIAAHNALTLHAMRYDADDTTITSTTGSVEVMTFDSFTITGGDGPNITAGRNIDIFAGVDVEARPAMTTAGHRLSVRAVEGMVNLAAGDGHLDGTDVDVFAGLNATIALGADGGANPRTIGIRAAQSIGGALFADETIDLLAAGAAYPDGVQPPPQADAGIDATARTTAIDGQGIRLAAPGPITGDYDSAGPLAASSGSDITGDYAGAWVDLFALGNIGSGDTDANVHARGPDTAHRDEATLTAAGASDDGNLTGRVDATVTVDDGGLRVLAFRSVDADLKAGPDVYDHASVRALAGRISGSVRAGGDVDLAAGADVEADVAAGRSAAMTSHRTIDANILAGHADPLSVNLDQPPAPDPGQFGSDGSATVLALETIKGSVHAGDDAELVAEIVDAPVWTAFGDAIVTTRSDLTRPVHTGEDAHVSVLGAIADSAAITANRHAEVAATDPILGPITANTGDANVFAGHSARAAITATQGSIDLLSIGDITAPVSAGAAADVQSFGDLTADVSSASHAIGDASVSVSGKIEADITAFNGSANVSALGRIVGDVRASNGTIDLFTPRTFAGEVGAAVGQTLPTAASIFATAGIANANIVAENLDVTALETITDSVLDAATGDLTVTTIHQLDALTLHAGQNAEVVGLGGDIHRFDLDSGGDAAVFLAGDLFASTAQSNANLDLFVSGDIIGEDGNSGYSFSADGRASVSATGLVTFTGVDGVAGATVFADAGFNYGGIRATAGDVAFWAGDHSAFNAVDAAGDATVFVDGTFNAQVTAGGDADVMATGDIGEAITTGTGDLRVTAMGTIQTGAHLDAANDLQAYADLAIRANDIDAGRDAWLFSAGDLLVGNVDAHRHLRALVAEADISGNFTAATGDIARVIAHGDININTTFTAAQGAIDNVLARGQIFGVTFSAAGHIDRVTAWDGILSSAAGPELRTTFTAHSIGTIRSYDLLDADLTATRTDGQTAIHHIVVAGAITGDILVANPSVDIDELISGVEIVLGTAPDELDLNGASVETQIAFDLSIFGDYPGDGPYTWWIAADDVPWSFDRVRAQFEEVKAALEALRRDAALQDAALAEQRQAMGDQTAAAEARAETASATARAAALATLDRLVARAEVAAEAVEQAVAFGTEQTHAAALAAVLAAQAELDVARVSLAVAGTRDAALVDVARAELRASAELHATLKSLTITRHADGLHIQRDKLQSEAAARAADWWQKAAKASAEFTELATKLYTEKVLDSLQDLLDILADALDFVPKLGWLASAGIDLVNGTISLLRGNIAEGTVRVTVGLLPRVGRAARQGVKMTTRMNRAARFADDMAETSAKLGHQATKRARRGPDAGVAPRSGVSTTAKGELGEAAASRTLQRAGYEQLPSKLSRNSGIDGVFVRRGADGEIDDIIVVESKFSSTGRAYLANTKTMGKQLSTQWIDGNIQKMLNSADPAVRRAGMLLDTNRSLIRTKANVLDAAGRNRWNRIRIPE